MQKWQQDDEGELLAVAYIVRRQIRSDGVGVLRYIVADVYTLALIIRITVAALDSEE